MKRLTSFLFFVFLILGIHAAYAGNTPVAVFFAIICASENIAVSIDYWPRLRKGKS